MAIARKCPFIRDSRDFGWSMSMRPPASYLPRHGGKGSVSEALALHPPIGFTQIIGIGGGSRRRGTSPRYRGGLATPTEATASPSYGGSAMWYRPLSITLRITKTRTSWTISIRVNVIS